MSYEEDVIHQNLEIIEERLRNVFNCGRKDVEYKCKKEAEDEITRQTAALKTLTDEEIRLVAEDAYKRGYADAWKKKPMNTNVFVRKEEKSPSD